MNINERERRRRRRAEGEAETERRKGVAGRERLKKENCERTQTGPRKGRRDRHTERLSRWLS